MKGLGCIVVLAWIASSVQGGAMDANDPYPFAALSSTASNSNWGKVEKATKEVNEVKTPVRYTVLNDAEDDEFDEVGLMGPGVGPVQEALRHGRGADVLGVLGERPANCGFPAPSPCDRPTCLPPTPPPLPIQEERDEPGFRFERVGCRFYALGTAVFRNKRDAENLCNAIGGTLASIDPRNAGRLACRQVRTSIVKDVRWGVPRSLLRYYVDEVACPQRMGFICELRNDQAIWEQRNKVVDLMATNPCQFIQPYWRVRVRSSRRVRPYRGRECRRCRGPCDRNFVSPIVEEQPPAPGCRPCNRPCWFDRSESIGDEVDDVSESRGPCRRRCRPCERLRRIDRNRPDVGEVLAEFDEGRLRPELGGRCSPCRRINRLDRRRRQVDDSFDEEVEAIEEEFDGVRRRPCHRRRRCRRDYDSSIYSDSEDVLGEDESLSDIYGDCDYTSFDDVLGDRLDRRPFNPCGCTSKSVIEKKIPVVEQTKNKAKKTKKH